MGSLETNLLSQARVASGYYPRYQATYSWRDRAAYSRARTLKRGADLAVSLLSDLGLVFHICCLPEC